MNRLSHILILGLLALLVTMSASANTLTPFTDAPGTAPTVIGSLPPGTLVATTGLIHYSFGTFSNPTKNTGNLIENVYRDSSGFLFFVFQIQVTKGDIKTISTGDWSNGTSINLEEYSAGGTIKPTGVDRNGFGTIGINFYNPLVLAGKTSYDIIFYTDAKGFIPGAIGLIDSGSSPSIPGFVAAPEPATLSLLGVGLVGLGTLRKRLFN